MMIGLLIMAVIVLFSIDCTKDYVQVFSGSSISQDDLIPFPGKAGARICSPLASTFVFSVDSSVTTFFYHTDDNNLGDMNVRGVEIPYTLIGKCTLPLILPHSPSIHTLLIAVIWHHIFGITVFPVETLLIHCLDLDECAPNGQGSRCNTCTNLIGSFECSCNAGFYLSEAASTCFGETITKEPILYYC